MPRNAVSSTYQYLALHYKGYLYRALGTWLLIWWPSITWVPLHNMIIPSHQEWTSMGMMTREVRATTAPEQLASNAMPLAPHTSRTVLLRGQLRSASVANTLADYIRQHAQQDLVLVNALDSGEVPMPSAATLHQQGRKSLWEHWAHVDCSEPCWHCFHCAWTHQCRMLHLLKHSDPELQYYLPDVCPPGMYLSLQIRPDVKVVYCRDQHPLALMKGPTRACLLRLTT